MNETSIQEIEQAILGAVILETKSAYSQIGDLLEPAHFRTEKYAKIWQALREMDSEGFSIDHLSVTQRLIQKWGFPQIGTPYELAVLTNGVNQAGNIVTHAYILKQDYISRKLNSISVMIAEKSKDPTNDPLEMLSTVSSEVIALNSVTIKSEPKHISFALIEHEKEVAEIAQSDGGMIGIPFGVSEFDRIIGGWRRGKLYVVAARPGMGKSIVALQSAKVASEEGATLVISLEMGRKELVDRLLASISGIDSELISSGKIGANSHNNSRLFEAKQIASNLNLYLHSTSSLSILELLALARRMHHKSEGGLKMLVVDYIQLMSGSGKKGQSREQEISEISRGLKNIAIELDIPVIALSQLSRAVETRGGDKRPILSDLRESGSIEQDADSVVFLFRPSYYGITEDENGQPIGNLCEMIIAKHRGGRLGIAKAGASLPQMRFDSYGLEMPTSLMPF